MIISKTPYRISFFGGGTDYPSWYKKHGGEVLATAINKYCYISCRYLPPFFEHRSRIVYSNIETVKEIDEIDHPSVREVLRYLKIERGIEIHHDGDLPARSGIGSSSAFTVGLLNAVYALKGQISNKHQLCEESIHIEQQLLQEHVGSQDQTLAAYGGFNHISFLESEDIIVKPVTLLPERIEELNSQLMLFYTGIKRTASNIAMSYVRELDEKELELNKLRGMVYEGLSLLNSNANIEKFGQLLHEAWQIKRELSSRVSNPQIENLYDLALSAGATGGKLIGAGGGGFMLLFVRRSKQEEVRKRLSALIHVPFKFEPSGSQIVVYEQQEDYTNAELERLDHPIASFKEFEDVSATG
jgi:D-glycero-alpha-D-manno-heptose-7-phosphate kinase